MTERTVLTPDSSDTLLLSCRSTERWTDLGDDGGQSGMTKHLRADRDDVGPREYRSEANHKKNSVVFFFREEPTVPSKEDPRSRRSPTTFPDRHDYIRIYWYHIA